MIRGNITEFGKDNGMESVTVSIRAASKPGAIMAARLTAIPLIPLREQSLGAVKSVSNMRMFDQWVVTIRDTKELENIGR